MEKSELLRYLQEQQNKWETLLDEIGPARMEQPGVNGEWSMKDMVAHLTGWNRRLLADLQSAQQGKPEPAPPWPTDLHTEDEINAWIYRANHRRPLHEVLDDMRDVHQQILASISELPADVKIDKVEPKFYVVWVGDKRFPVGEFFDHFYDDHEPDVRRWLSGQ